MINVIRDDEELKYKIGDFIYSCITMDNGFIYYKNYYLRLATDKKISEICVDLAIDEIVIEFFIIPGGASKEYNGYLFVVHSDEDVHKFSIPHVHVKRDDYSPRYRLDTFEMIEGDSSCRQYK